MGGLLSYGGLLFGTEEPLLVPPVLTLHPF